MVARASRHIVRGFYHTRFCVLLLVGCGTEPAPDKPESTIHESQGTSLLIQVVDTSNNPIPSALLTAFGESMRPTDGAGYILYENVIPGRFSARIEKLGYAPASVVVELPEGVHGGTEVRLIPFPSRIPFDAASGAALDQNSVHITIPSNAIVDGNGEPFTGMAEATIVPLDPTTDLANAPGPLQGIDVNGAAVGLESLYMADVTLWNGAQKLQLGSGKKATIEMVLPDSIAANVQTGQTIPAWSFDLDAGVWREEGAGTVQASIAEPGKTAWVTQVGHFTWWNCDAPWTEKHCFIVPVVFADGASAIGIRVGAEGVNYNGSSTPQFTNGGGLACVDVMLNGTANLHLGPINAPVATLPVTGSGPPADCATHYADCVTLSPVVLAQPICTPGQYQNCPYSGPPGTDLVGGNCIPGKGMCNTWGTDWVNCVGEILPQLEDCNAPGDEDCDGLVNEEGDNCACMQGETAACYTGRTGTLGLGICAGGQRNCNNGFFGPCMNEVTPQVESCATANVDDNCDGTTECHGFGMWSKIFGDAGGQSNTVVAVDGAGNVVVVGDFGGTVDFGGGPLTSAGGYDVAVVKFDSNGNFLWAKRFGDTGQQLAYAVATDSAGNIVLAGYFSGILDFGGGPLVNGGSGGIFIAQLDSNGDHLWSRQVLASAGVTGLSVEDVATDGVDNVVLAGNVFGTDSVDFGNGPLNGAGSSDPFIAKFASNGSLHWAKRFGDADMQNADAVVVDVAGDIVLTGWFQGSVDFGGGLLTNVGAEDGFVVKLNSSGDHLWSRRFQEANNNEYGAVQPDDCAIDSAGDIVVSGTYRGTVDFGAGPVDSMNGGYVPVFITKLNLNGDILWSRSFGDIMSSIVPRPIAFDNISNVVLAGHFHGIVDWGGGPLTAVGSNADVFVAKLDPSGNHLWSRRFGDASHQSVNHIAADYAGNVVVVGEGSGTIDFGTGPLTTAATWDVFLAKLTP